MSFIDGFVACAISEEGHSDVVRVNLAKREKMMYSIDSEDVEGLRVFQDAQELAADISSLGGKTLIQFSASPNNWFGMTYRRVNFVAQKDGVWEYKDNWSIPDEVVFTLMLPKYAVIERLNVTDLAREPFDFDDHVVLTQVFPGGDLSVDMKYVFDSKQYATLKYPELKRSNFPYAKQNPDTSVVFGSHSPALSRAPNVLSSLSSGLDWIGRGVTLYEALRYLGLLK